MNAFKLDRIVFDRSIWVIYYPSVTKDADNNKFDPDLIEYHDLEDHVKKTQFKRTGRETVLAYEFGSPKPYIKYEMRLRSTRSMNIYFNFNRYFMQKLNLLHDEKTPIIHDDNFLPLNARVTASDFLEVYKNKFPEEMIRRYKEWYQKLWPTEYAILEKYDEEPICRCTTLEVAREMYPLNVNSVKNDIQPMGSKYTSWNNASNVLHFGEAPKTDSEYRIDGTTLKTNISNWNHKPIYEKPMHSKLYQKSVNLARFEITLYDDQIDFNSIHPVEDIKFTIQEYLEATGLNLTCMKKKYYDTIHELCKVLKIDEDLLELIILSGSQWKSNKENRHLTDKLIRKKVIEKISRGNYAVNPAFVELCKKAQGYTPEEEYIPKYL